MKILLVGNIEGASRSQLLIHRLINFQAGKPYIISICGTDFYAKHANKSPKIVKIFHKIIFGIELFIKIGFSDLIYVMAMNHLCIKPVLFCNFFWRKKIITDLYISAYDTGVDRGYFDTETKENQKLKKKLISYDKLILEKSTIVIHLTTGELKYIVKLVNANFNYSKARIIPLGIERKMIAKPALSNIYRIAWWGTWIPLHGIDNILKAVHILSLKLDNFRLDMYGVEGSIKDFYLKEIIRLKINDKVIIHTDKSFANGKLEQALAYDCDLALGNFGESAKAENVIVNKIVDAMSMRLPVLTMKNKVLEEFIDINNDLFTCTNDPNEMANALLTILTKPDEMYRRAENGFYCYEKQFSPSIYTEKVLEIIDTINSDN